MYWGRICLHSRRSKRTPFRKYVLNEISRKTTWTVLLEVFSMGALQYLHLLTVPWSSAVLLNQVNGSPQREWKFCRGEWHFSSSIFVSSGNVRFPCFLTQHIAWRTSSVITLRYLTAVSNLSLQKNCSMVQLTAFIKKRVDFTERCHVLLNLSDGISAVLCMSVLYSCVNVICYRGIAVLSKVSFSISSENQTPDHSSG